MKIIRPITFLMLFIFSIFLIPFYFAFFLAIIYMFYFPFTLEIIFLFLVVDLLYSTNEVKFHGIFFLNLFNFILFFLTIEILKNKMKFYSDKNIL